jgi:hypothetical protein
VDRGPQQLETVSLLLCYKVKYPERFFLLRGNHETLTINHHYGFHAEIEQRYGNDARLWENFNVGTPPPHYSFLSLSLPEPPLSPFRPPSSTFPTRR